MSNEKTSYHSARTGSHLGPVHSEAVIEGDVYLSQGGKTIPIIVAVVRLIPADSVAAARREICAESVLWRRVDSLFAAIKEARATADSVRRAIKPGQSDQERAAAGARADSVAKFASSQALSLLEIASEAFAARLTRAIRRRVVNGRQWTLPGRLARSRPIRVVGGDAVSGRGAVLLAHGFDDSIGPQNC